MARWFRFYSEVLDDPKVQRLPPSLFRSWINILCLTSRHDGTLPDLGGIAFSLRMSEAEAVETIDSLVAAGLLDRDETGLKPHNWRARQHLGDVSTERVKRFRKRAMKRDETEPETKMKRTMKRHETVSETVSETAPDTDTDTDSPPPIVPPPTGEVEIDGFSIWYDAYPRKEARRAAARAYRAALKRATAEQLLDGARGYAEARAGQDRQFTKLPATWLNADCWLDKPAPEPAGAPSADAETARWRARLRNYRPGGPWLDAWGARPETGRNASIPGPVLAAWRQQVPA